jgi:hypothetical protein
VGGRASFFGTNYQADGGNPDGTLHKLDIFSAPVAAP